MGRPTKLTDNYLKALEKVLNNELNAIIHTDEELFLLINEQLDDSEKICYATFKNYKSENLTDEKIEAFLALYKKALANQKNELFKSLKSDDKAWQRWAWIIERKFDDWNLRNIGVQKVDLKTEIKVKLPDDN